MPDVKKTVPCRKALLAAALLFCGCATLPSRYEALSPGLRAETSLAGVLAGVENADVVFVGESHESRRDHLVQLEVIKHLNEKGIKTVLALEMFPSGTQLYLNEFTKGGISWQEFRRLYDNSWHVPYSYYADIFRYAKRNGIPLVGVNTEDALIRDVAENGTGVLSKETLDRVGFRDCASAPGYEKILDFAGLSGEHGKALTHLCDAQRFRDYAMAYYIHCLAGRGGTVVALIGAAHASGVAVPGMLREQGYTGKIRILLPENIRGLLGEIDSSTADYIWY